MTIKAIETQYKGYRFRSRLEARWAVFFDAIGWPWDYEPEGFTWHERSYLPDFVCQLNIPFYFEIKRRYSIDEKPQALDVLGQWFDFAIHFVNAERGAILVFGSPWIDMAAWVASWDNEAGRLRIEENVFLDQCPCCEKPSLLTVGKEVKRTFWNAPKFNRRPYERARSARFEHGETPK
jgi:hypothetical protein